MSNYLSRITYLPLAVLTISGLSACQAGFNQSDSGSGDNNGTEIVITNGTTYFGPDGWELTLDDDDANFRIVKTNPLTDNEEYTITGNESSTTGGFTLLSVVSSTNTSIAAVDDELPIIKAEDSLIFMLEPGDRDAPIVSLVEKEETACPTSLDSRNWIGYYTTGDASSASVDFFGTFTLDGTTANRTAQYPLTDISTFTSSGSDSTTNNSACADGLINSDEADIYLSSKASAIVNYNDISTIVHASSELGTIDEIYHQDYVGFMHDQTKSSTTQNDEIRATCDSTGCSFYLVDDSNISAATQGDEIGTVATWNNLNSPANGFISGEMSLTVNETETTGNLVCSVETDWRQQGSNLMLCTGQALSDNSKQISFVLFAD